MRRTAIAKLRSKGRSLWNADSKLNMNELSVCRRPNEKFQRSAIDFDTCERCGEYLRGVRRHWNTCTGNPLPGEKTVKELSRIAEGRLHVEASGDLHTMFSKMHQHAEIHIIRFDWLIIVYGNDLCINLWQDYQFRVIKEKLRNAGKLLMVSKSICPEIDDFASLYRVSNCNTVIGAIRNIAGFNFETKEYRAPATAASLVTEVIAIGRSLRVEYMKQNNEEKQKAVEKFLDVFQMEARTKINKAVKVTQLNRRREKPRIIPTTHDVGKLSSFLDSEQKSSFSKLTERFSVDEWLRLTNLTALTLLLFNRKRVGDTQNILLKEFEKREIIAQHKDALSEETKHMIKSRLVIRGKLYREVHVLLKHITDDCLVLLTRYRETVGVPKENVYLFALPSPAGKIKKVDACALLRTYSEKCGAEDPKSLRGTFLRKHLASTCASLNLSDNDVTNVAKYLGHSEKIHRDVYRHNPLDGEVALMSEILGIAYGQSDANDISAISNMEAKPQRKRKRSPVATAVNAGKRSKMDNSNTERPKRGRKVIRCNGKTMDAKPRPASKSKTRA